MHTFGNKNVKGRFKNCINLKHILAEDLLILKLIDKVDLLLILVSLHPQSIRLDFNIRMLDD